MKEHICNVCILCCIHTNFQGMQFSRTIEIQDFHGFICEEHLLSTLVLHMHYKIRGFNFRG